MSRLTKLRVCTGPSVSHVDYLQIDQMSSFIQNIVLAASTEPLEFDD